MRSVVLLASSGVLAFLGCGRVDFELRTVDSGAGTGRAPDAAVGRCGEPRPVPDPVTISGTTFEYTNFTNGVKTVPNVDVSVMSGGTTLASTTSDMAGAYSFPVATQGQPIAAQLVYAVPGYFTSTIWLDEPLDRSLSGSPAPYAWPGDAPLWSPGAMGTVYSSTGVTEDNAAGSLNVQVVDCAHTPVDHVTVTITPPPGELDYLGSDGQPSPGATETMPPYDFAFAANAQAGPTHITLSGGGLTWPELEINVGSGASNTLVIARGVP